jgi:hypothetical protein
VELHGRSVTESSPFVQWIAGVASVRRDYAVNQRRDGRSSLGGSGQRGVSGEWWKSGVEMLGG